MAGPDLTYLQSGGIVRFYPETKAGEDAYNVMAKADPDGVVGFFPTQLPGVLAQLRKAGLRVLKGKPAKPVSAEELDAFLADLGD